jgi:hypothetical protein
MLRSAALGAVIALVAAGGASAETVARGVQDGAFAVDAKGSPSVAFVQGQTVVLVQRSTSGRWTRSAIASTPRGSSVMAFEIGKAGPVLLVASGDGRTLLLVRRRSVGWQTMGIAHFGNGPYHLGWPGLALDREGLPSIAYTRWDASTLKSRLLLTRVNGKGRLKTLRITAEGFPKSYVPPPATPVLFGNVAHVIESYGYKGVLGTFEWYPNKRTWTGLGLDAGIGDFPVGPVLAGVSGGTLHAAWTESLLSMDGTAAPTVLVARRHNADSEYVLDRALTTALALPASGPEVAANQWVGSADLGLDGDKFLWAGTIVRGTSHVEVDGWISGYAVAPQGARELLLGGPLGLRWFRVPHRLTTRVTLGAHDGGTMVSLSGEVPGVEKGSVTIYRERPGSLRTPVGSATISSGAFTFTDTPPLRPLVYRAVYVDPATGVPYAALLRRPLAAAGADGLAQRATLEPHPAPPARGR